MTTRPLLCLVTDRRRLARAMARPAADGCALVLEQIEGAVAGAVDLVQVRERDLDAADLVRLVAGALAIARGSPTRIVVNDRADVAMAAGAAGVHLPQASFPAAAVRRIAPTLLVGRSVHDAAGVAASGPVDYLIAGTVFPTASKPGGVRPIQLTGLAEIVRAAASTPVLAIGGIAPDRISALAATRAAGVAAIGAFMPTAPDQDIRGTVQQVAWEMRNAFDSNSAGS